jgi:hypothetical protein
MGRDGAATGVVLLIHPVISRDCNSVRPTLLELCRGYAGCQCRIWVMILWLHLYRLTATGNIRFIISSRTLGTSHAGLWCESVANRNKLTRLNLVIRRLPVIAILRKDGCRSFQRLAVVLLNNFGGLPR